MSERSYLGRGLDDIPGRPFGWAFEQERSEIRAHVLRRYDWGRGLDKATALHKLKLDSYVAKIQMRLHRYKPSLRERQEAAAAMRAASRGTAPQPQPFTADELARIAARFEGSNDPIGQSIYAKASA